jgi:hypothetical protein
MKNPKPKPKCLHCKHDRHINACTELFFTSNGHGGPAYKTCNCPGPFDYECDPRDAYPRGGYDP